MSSKAIARRKKSAPRRKASPSLTPAGVDRGRWFSIFDSRPGGWQMDLESISKDTLLAFSAVYRCITLISSDVAKLRLRLMEQGDNGIWKETTSPSFSPVLRKPNEFQNRQQFFSNWLSSKLISGNTYALKNYDARGVVTRLYILDPLRVTPLVTPTGSIFYRLDADNISGIEEQITVPADEIIHDRMPTLFHPLIGISPIFACGLAATQGLRIQGNSSKFFGNMSRPSGILTAPGTIATDTADRLKNKWEENYKGDKIGRVAVLGDGLKYESLSVTPEDAQMIEQLKWTAHDVCTAFGVPPYKIGVGDIPTYGNAEVLNQIYYGDVLQGLIESTELCLDEGIGLTAVTERALGTEFDTNDLLRMDTATRYRTWGEGIKAGMVAPNEARGREDLPPVAGGETPYLQSQNYSLAALAKRDAREDPFASAGAAPAAPPPASPASAAGEDDPSAAGKAIAAAFAPMVESMQVLAAEFKQLRALPPPPASDEPSQDDVEAWTANLAREFEAQLSA